MLFNVHQVEEIAPYRKVYLNNWANPFQNDFIFFSSSRASLIMKFLNIQITDLSKSFRQGRPIKIFFFESLGGLQEDFVARRDFFHSSCDMQPYFESVLTAKIAAYFHAIHQN